jgi:ring-1,2-phenylacetyl-CoA epoxidase subunit PaaE
MTPKFHTLKVKDLIKETEDTVSVEFLVPAELESDYKFLPGQYLTIKANVDKEEIRRSYSLCAAPFENQLKVAIKKVEGGQFSTFANNELKIGDELDVMTPMGKFTTSIDFTKARNHIFFAAGSGITPILSLIKALLNEEPESQITLIYGNKNFTSIIFREEIESLKNTHMDRFRVIHVLSRESLGNTLQKGRIDKEKCQDLNKAFFDVNNIDSVFICGPEDMIFAVKEVMENEGLESSKIHFELFTTVGQKINVVETPKDEKEVFAKVKVILDGDEVDLDIGSHGTSILDAAYDAGMDVPFACKGGVCCTCKAKVLEGSVRMDVNYALEPDEVKEGYILTCQSHPTSEKLIVTFDE